MTPEEATKRAEAWNARYCAKAKARKQRHPFYWLLWKLFGRKSVVLVDFDGESSARLARSIDDMHYAARRGFGIHHVWLLPNHSVSRKESRENCFRWHTYVDRWEPLYGGEPL